MWTVELLVMLAMIVINSVFAAYEIALASISVSRLQVLIRENRRGAKPALFMKENMEASLAVVQLGITLVGTIAAATGGAGAEVNLAPLLQEQFNFPPGMADVLAIAMIVIPLTVVTIIFGELIPKVFALRNKEWVCLKMSPSMRWFSFGVWPAVRTLEWVVITLMRWGERHWKARLEKQLKSEAAELQELRASVALARTSRLIGAQEEKIILVAAHLDMHTRFPVVERRGDLQSIVGYVNFKDIVAQMRLAPHEPTIRGIVRSMPSLQEDMPVSSCLEKLIRDHTHIALIRDGTGQVVGMVTLEDMIEELVGEIEDEYDRLPAHAAKSGKGWVVGGGISLERLRELTAQDLKADLPNPDVRHLSDWVIGHLARPVSGGEVLERGDLRVVVRKVRRQKVLEAQVERPLIM